MRMPIAMPLAALLLLSVAPARAQDSPGTPSGEPEAAPAGPEQPERPDPRTLVGRALRNLKSNDTLLVEVVVRHERPRQQGAPVQGGGIVIMRSTNLNEREPYEGALEAWRTADGVTVLTSEKALPGFEIYAGPERGIVRTTTDGDSPGLDRLQAELVPLLDADRLTRHLLDRIDDLDWAWDDATGRLVLQGELARELVKPTVSSALAMPARVLRVHVRLQLNQEGRLESLVARVVHNDPVAEMMRGRMPKEVQIRIRAGQGGAVPLPPQPEAEDDEKHDVEGDTAVYTLTFGDRQPSERARAFRRDVQRLLGE